MLKLVAAGAIVALFLIFSASPALVSAKENEMINGEVHYLAADVKSPLTQKFEYSDEWLKSPSSQAPYDMLQFSICAAVASCFAEDITDLFDQIGYSYTNNVNEEKEGLNILAGDNITDSVYYPALTIDGIPYYNSVGYAIGSKKIDDFTAIMVGLRGGFYGIEWGGNFNIGTGENHEGFQIASDQVLEGIRNYISRNAIDGKKKIWLVGYSRGAAVANLTAARIVDGELGGFDPEDVYSFSFECPRNTRSPEAFAERYNGIHSVSNPSDLIPKTAMAVWGYRRFGKTYFIPSYETDVDFKKSYDAMIPTQLTVLPFVIGYATDDLHTLDTFATNLAISAVNPQYYTEHFQEALMHVAARFFGGAKQEPTEQDYIALRELEMSIQSLNPANAQRMLKLVDAKPTGNGMFTFDFECPLLRAHWMETSMGWVQALNSYDEFGPSAIRLAYINGVKNITVVDSDGKTVAEVKDGELKEIEGGLWAQFNPNSQLVVVMPANGSYTINFKAAEKGLANYSIAEVDLQYGQKRKIINYGAIDTDPLVSLQSLIGPMGSENTYSLLQNNKLVEPKMVLTGDEVEHYIITTKAEGEGHTVGGGEFSQGEVVGLYADPMDGKKFVGWYVGEEMVSDKPAYQFIASESLEVTAKFADK